MSGEPVRPDVAQRVLLVHNAYQQAGGEDSVVKGELALLRDHGHEVIELRRDNRQIDGMSRPELALRTLWSSGTHDSATQLLREHRPDVVHVHNTFPLISPSLYWACASAGVPVVQTLHNFRLACPQAMFLRDGQVCEQCLGKMPWRAVVHACYRDSAAQSAVIVGMLGLHRALGTYASKVTRYIALNQFCRDKFVQAGLPSQRLVVKPNFVAIPRPDQQPRQGLLFVGRLSPEKGIAVLQQAWTSCADQSLRVVGSGPEGTRLGGLPGIECLGPRTSSQVQFEMQRSRALIVPSLWFENFPMVLIEAYACGLPVIASNIGALAEVVEHGHTGLLFRAGDAVDLARTVRWAAEHPVEMARMGRNARARYEERYTPDINYRQLLAIYRDAIEEAGHAKLS